MVIPMVIPMVVPMVIPMVNRFNNIPMVKKW